MKLAVLYTWARDPDFAAVRADGAIEWRGAKMVAGEDDHAALAAAKALSDSAGADLVGVTIGNGDASWVLARGVEETYSVADAPALDDQGVTGRILAAAIAHIGGIDVVAMGDAQQYRGVPVAVAASLGWPILLGLTSATSVGDHIIATRRGPATSTQLSINPPVVLAFSAEAAEQRAPGMKEVLAARRRPVTRLSMADLGVTATERVRSEDSRLPQSGAARVFEGDPQQSARQLVEALRAEGVL